jgi:hypothetical protein
LLTYLKNTDVMNVNVMWKIHWCHKCICHVWNKHWCRHVWKNTDVFTFRSGPMIFGILQTWHTHLWHQHIFDMTLTFVYFTWHLYLWQQCFSDITATFRQLITRPKIIGPKQNVNVICIIHSHTKYQVNISKHSKKKWWQLFYFGITELGNTICPSHLC